MKDRLKILLPTVLSLLVLDQVTKALVVGSMPIGSHIPVIEGIFDIVHTRNRGAAFGLFSTLPDSIRNPFFFISSLISFTVLLAYYFRVREDRPNYFFILALIVGGALGNVVDRVFRGEVVDFLSFHWYDHWVHLGRGAWAATIPLEWPAFNIADTGITGGVFGLMILMLKTRNK